MEENYDCLLSTLLNVYRATEVMFLGEDELEEARSFSKTLLQRGLTMKNAKDSVVTFNLQREVISHMIQDHATHNYKQSYIVILLLVRIIGLLWLKHSLGLDHGLIHKGHRPLPTTCPVITVWW